VAVFLIPVKTKQIGINIDKRKNTKNTVQTIQNIVNTSTRITKTPTITHPHTLPNPQLHTPTHYQTHNYTHPHITKPTITHTRTLQNNLKQPQYKIHTKRNSHNIIKYPQCKVTLIYNVHLSPRTFKTERNVTQITNRNAV